MFRDYYAVLNVSPQASGEEIRQAFKRLALLHHPDRVQQGVAESAQAAHLSSFPSLHRTQRDGASHGVSSPVETGGVSATAAGSTHAFTAIQEAYEVLSDVARRYLYDMNYQEMVQWQEQQREAERLRRAEQQRVMEAAAVAAALAATRARSPAAPQGSTLPALCSSPPPLVGPATSNAPSSPPLSPPSEPALPPLTARRAADVVRSGDLPHTAASTGSARTLADLESDRQTAGPSGVVYSATAPLPRRTDRQRQQATRRGQRRGGGRGRAEPPAMARGGAESAWVLHSDAGAAPASSQLSALRRKPHPLPAASSAFLVTNSLAATSDGGATAAMAASSLSLRAAGGRPSLVREGDDADSGGERPLAYYHQRSIERTLRVFFEAPEST